MVEDPVKPIEDHGLRETQVVELAMSVSALSVCELAESHVDAAPLEFINECKSLPAK